MKKYLRLLSFYLSRIRELEIVTHLRIYRNWRGKTHAFFLLKFFIKTPTSKDIHGDDGAGFGVVKGIVMVFHLIAKVFRHGLEFVVLQV